jgi:transcriptional regulator with XRE-family HTH domain
MRRDEKDFDPQVGLPLRLKQRMRAMEMSAHKLSMLCGMGGDAARNILRGRSQAPRAETIEKMALVLGTSVEWLLSGTGPEVTGPSQRPLVANPSLGREGEPPPAKSLFPAPTHMAREARIIHHETKIAVCQSMLTTLSVMLGELNEEFRSLIDPR